MMKKVLNLSDWSYPARVATIAKEIYLGLRLELCAVVALDRSNEDKNV